MHNKCGSLFIQTELIVEGTSLDAVRLGGVGNSDLPSSNKEAATSPLHPPAYETSLFPETPSSEDGIERPRGAYFPSPTTLPPAPQATPDEVEVAGLSSDLLHPALSLRPARGGRKPRKKSVLWEVTRSLTPDDIALLNTTLPAPRASLTQIRHSHHQLAQLLSEGRTQHEAALLSGYSPTYVSILKDDPSFQELIAYYAQQQELVYVNVLERMKSLGLSTIDELQSRLEEDPSGFSNRELMEQAELMLVKPMVATRGGILPGASSGPGVQSGGISLNVNFIGHATPQPQPPDLQTNRPDAPTIDVEFASIPDDDRRDAGGRFK